MLVNSCSCAGFQPPETTVSPRARRPAAEKRQGTKSREVGYWLAASAMGKSAPNSFAVGTPTRLMYQRRDR
jgi:hypothetical protein